MADATAYARVLAMLLPPGRAMALKSGGVFEKLLEGLAVEPAIFEQRIRDLMREADPRETVELAEEWKREVGLPNGCIQDLEVLQLWRRAVVAILRGQGGASRQFFIDLGHLLGYEQVEITEYSPFQVGISGAGSGLSNGGWQWTWDVHVTEIAPAFFTAGQSLAGEPLTVNHNELLECLFKAAAPAHTLVRVFFDLPYTGYQPWNPMEIYPAALVYRAEVQAPVLEV